MNVVQQFCTCNLKEHPGNSKDDDSGLVVHYWCGLPKSDWYLMAVRYRKDLPVPSEELWNTYAAVADLSGMHAPSNS